MSDVRIPNLGESVTEAIIAKWVKAEGERVDANDVVVELETDKAAVELPAGAAGVLHIVQGVGAKVNVGQAIAQINPAGASPAAPAASSAPPRAGAITPSPAETPPGTQNQESENEPDARAAAQRGASQDTRQPLSTPGTTTVYNPAEAPEPAGGKAPARGGLGDDRVPARGGAGFGDDRAPARGGAGLGAGTDPSTPRPLDPSTPSERVPLSMLRQTIARRLVEAQHATASLTTFNEVDMSAILAIREKYKEPFEKAYGVGLGFMSFFARAVIRALTAVPAVNASWDSDALLYHRYVHLGIAVSTDKGLMVPVVRNAQMLSMAGIEGEIKRLATKARDGKIAPDDLAGGTFTITNGGIFGSLLSTPILNPPQAAILGMHKIQKRAVVITDAAGNDTIVVRPMMNLALTYDHRIVDGQQSVTFLVKVKEALEDPTRLLLEV